MKNKLFIIILSALLTLGISGCGLFKKVPKENNQLGTAVMYGQTMTINSRQLDSICFVDGLSRDLSNWLKMLYYDNETGEPIYRYAFIKAVSEDNELTYILTPADTLYVITKRIVVIEEETE